MALGFVTFGIFVAIASATAAAAMGVGAFCVMLAYAGCGTAVLIAALLSAMIFDRDDTLHEDPMLVPGK